MDAENKQRSAPRGAGGRQKKQKTAVGRKQQHFFNLIRSAIKKLGKKLAESDMLLPTGKR